jgi:endonuclease I
MRGDLHHLFACESRCNSFRGNTPYFDFEDFGEVIRDNCGKIAGERFEPTAGKGVVARATFYFLLRYPGEINNVEQEYQVERLPILLDWHKTFPVTDYERHRNAAIYDKQGNRNPLIDFPEWAEKIDFRIGLGA